GCYLFLKEPPRRPKSLAFALLERFNAGDAAPALAWLPDPNGPSPLQGLIVIHVDGQGRTLLSHEFPLGDRTLLLPAGSVIAAPPPDTAEHILIQAPESSPTVSAPSVMARPEIRVRLEPSESAGVLEAEWDGQGVFPSIRYFFRGAAGALSSLAYDVF